MLVLHKLWLSPSWRDNRLRWINSNRSLRERLKTQTSPLNPLLQKITQPHTYLATVKLNLTPYLHNAAHFQPSRLGEQYWDGRTPLPTNLPTTVKQLPISLDKREKCLPKLLPRTQRYSGTKVRSHGRIEHLDLFFRRYEKILWDGCFVSFRWINSFYI